MDEQLDRIEAMLKYLVIKHCSDDEDGALGVNYDKYNDLVSILEEAEKRSTDDYLVKANITLKQLSERVKKAIETGK